MRDRRSKRTRGAALLLVLWVFMILGVLALDFARYMRDDARAALNFVEETRGYYVAVAAMNRAVWDAMRLRDQGPASGAEDDEGEAGADSGRLAGMRDDDIMPTDGQWREGVFGDARYQVRITDEGGRIAINRAPEAVLRRVVTNLLVGGVVQGMGRQEAARIDGIVDAVLDWRDTDNLERMHGAESEFYLNGPGGYPAKNGFLDAPEELLLVRGITAELFYGHDGVPGLRDVVSVFNRSGRLNARTLTPAVLQALLAVGPEEAAELIAERTASPEAFLTRLQAQLATIDPTLSDLLTDEPASTVLVEARADTREERNQARVAAVFELGADDFDGPRVRRWFDRAPWEGTLPSGAGRDSGA